MANCPRAVWSVDNRTAGFRLCGEGTKAARIECRIGGADLIRGLATAYEVQVDLVKGISLHEFKIDHVAHLGPSVAAGLGTHPEAGHDTRRGAGGRDRYRGRVHRARAGSPGQASVTIVPVTLEWARWDRPAGDAE